MLLLRVTSLGDLSEFLGLLACEPSVVFGHVECAVRHRSGEDGSPLPSTRITRAVTATVGPTRVPVAKHRPRAPKSYRSVCAASFAHAGASHLPTITVRTAPEQDVMPMRG